MSKRTQTPYLLWLRELPCTVALAVPGNNNACVGDVCGDHYPTVGSAGKNHDNAWPLCVKHHTEQHALGMATFARKYGLGTPENVKAYIGRLQALFAEKFSTTEGEKR